MGLPTFVKYVHVPAASVTPPKSPTEPAAPEPQALFAEARRHRRQRRLRVALLVLAGAAAGGGFYGVFGGGSAHLPTVPQIEAAVAAQLAHSRDLILRDHTVRSNSVIAVPWLDLSTGDQRLATYRPNGEPVDAQVMVVSRDVRKSTVVDTSTTFIDYQAHAWASYRGLSRLLRAGTPLAPPILSVRGSLSACSVRARSTDGGCSTSVLPIP